jgi:HEAT repeat protein
VCRMAQPDDQADQATRANASLALAAAVFDSERLRKEIVHALVPLLDDPDSQVRWAAIHGFESLGNLNDPALLDRLIRIAKDSTTRVRGGATIYRQDLRNGDSICFRKATQERLRLAAIDCLATIDGRSKEVASVMIEAVADGDPLTRLHALCALGNSGRPDKAVVPVLIDWLHGDGARKNDAGRACFESEEHSVPIKLAALALLGQIGRESTAAIPDLIDLFADPVAEVRERSAEVLGLIGLEAASCVPALIRQIERDQIDFGTGKTTVEAIGLPAQAALIGMISNHSLPIVDRIGAVEVLASQGVEADDAIPNLKELLVTAEPALRRAIDRAIRAIEVGSRASKFGAESEALRQNRLEPTSSVLRFGLYASCGVIS